MIRTRDPQIASLPFNQLSYAESYQKSYKQYLLIKSNFHCLFRKEVRQTMEVSRSFLTFKKVTHYFDFYCFYFKTHIK